jgi:hypothetical protein
LCPHGAYKENIQREKSKKERIPHKHKTNEGRGKHLTRFHNVNARKKLSMGNIYIKAS